jgi:hypothetical protein
MFIYTKGRDVNIRSACVYLYQLLPQEKGLGTRHEFRWRCFDISHWGTALAGKRGVSADSLTASLTYGILFCSLATPPNLGRPDRQWHSLHRVIFTAIGSFQVLPIILQNRELFCSSHPLACQCLAFRRQIPRNADELRWGTGRMVYITPEILSASSYVPR